MNILAIRNSFSSLTILCIYSYLSSTKRLLKKDNEGYIFPSFGLYLCIQLYFPYFTFSIGKAQYFYFYWKILINKTIRVTGFVSTVFKKTILVLNFLYLKIQNLWEDNWMAFKNWVEFYLSDINNQVVIIEFKM